MHEDGLELAQRSSVERARRGDGSSGRQWQEWLTIRAGFRLVGTDGELHHYEALLDIGHRPV